MTRKLEIRMLHYFLLITLAAIMIGIEFYVEMNRPDLQAVICTDTPDGGQTALAHLRNKVVIMFGVLTVVVAIVMTMFIRNITMPLCQIVDVAEKINQGDLSQVVRVDSQDEIGEVGNTINALTSNLQEVAAFTAVTCNEAADKVTDILQRLERGESADRRALEDVKENLDALRSFVDSFKLL